MKVDVPFHASKDDNECAQRCLQMALDHFGKKIDILELSKLSKQLKSGMTLTMGVASAAKKLGLNVRVFSHKNFQLKKEDFHPRKNEATKENPKIINELRKELKSLNIKVEEKNPTLLELTSLLDKDHLPIVLVNWFTLANEKGFSGHFLLLTGHDKENIYVHNPGIASAKANLKLKKEIFKKAWEYPGTDKDIILISRSTEVPNKNNMV